MYYELYQSLKQQIASSLNLTIQSNTGKISNGDPTGLQDIQWLDTQYEGTISMLPVLFIEFTPLVINRQTKTSGSTEIGIRLHVVSGAAMGGEDDEVVQHEALAQRVLEAVEDGLFSFQGKETRPLRLTGWTYHHKYHECMATWIDFKTKG